MFEPESTKKLIKYEQLPKIDVDVGRLCNLVESIWSNSNLEIQDVDQMEHDVFISDIKRCWSYHNQRQDEIEELNYRFTSSTDLPNCIKATESSKAKMKIDISTQQNQDQAHKTKVKTNKRKKMQKTTESNHGILSILEKPPIDRTREEVQQGFKILKTLPALSHLSDFIVSQIMNVATFVTFDELSIVFRQGDEGTAWYVILDGGVNIFISPPEYIITSRFSEIDDKKNFELILKNSKRVAHLEKGFGFGELAMVNDAPRAASVITTAPTTLLKMEKRDYIRILKSIHDQEIRSKILFLKKLPIISDTITLKNLASAMEIKSYPSNSFILKEGTPVQYLYIIKSGKCLATKSCTDPKSLDLKLGTFKELDYFGEDYLSYLLRSDTTDQEWPCKFSIKTITPVTIGLISIHDAVKAFPSNTPLSPISLLASNPRELRLLAFKTIERKSYLAEKSKILDSLYREMYADPRVNRKNIKTLLK